MNLPRFGGFAGSKIALLGLAIFIFACGIRPAAAVPSFAQQTGQPCASCHVGAFGPQLTEYGREFKLNGYVATDGGDHLPLAMMVQSSFTHTSADQPGATPHFGPNDNLAVDQVSLFYAGRLTDSIGAFVQTTYDGVGRNFTWDNADIRFAQTGSLLGSPLLYGATLNNNPTVQDAWNSTPGWGFPFAQSPLAASPQAATLIDGGLAQQVVGAGAYALWNDLLYVEADAYSGLGKDVRNGLGVVPVSGADEYDGLFPYWRLALQHNFGSHYLELGTFGLSAKRIPGGDRSAGTDRITDVAADLTYLYGGDPDNPITGYVTYIHEHQGLDASSVLSGTNKSDYLNTFRVNGSYSYQNTFTFSGQRFQTRGSSDFAQYSGNGSPNSAGWIGEIAYVPGGKLDSWLPLPQWFNGRLSLQYTAYTEFNGTSSHASDNNTLYALLWLAW